MLTAFIYPGGKVRISSWVTSFFPRHRIYVEPFGGAAGVLLNKTPSPLEVYNDLNSDLVNFFRVLRDKEKAAEFIPRYDTPDTLWYLDPPYNCGYSFRYRASVDQEAMLGAFKKVSGYVVLSGYMSELYADELAGWHMETRTNQTFGHKDKEECLWLSPRTWDALQRERDPGVLRLLSCGYHLAAL